ncbi:unnamed protein product [Phytomonas sp. Hart1]|nr:unnamed protein product [Phytomonas sp. Hart1]|eukprot:CCW68593.1 unnamed protein product [Phytomonas sp. isolate Hart1]
MFRRLFTSIQPTTALVSGTHALALRFCISINVPMIAESINSGKVVNLTKNVGDPVSEDEVICQIESDKLNVDVRAPADGVITKINFQNGDDVEVGAELSKMKKQSVAPNAETPTPKAEQPTPKSEAPAAKVEAATPPPKADPAPERPSAPRVQEFFGSDPRIKSVRISSMRQRIADRLKASQNTAAMLTTFNEIDMTPIMSIRNKFKDDFHKRHDVKLGLMSPFVKACAIALKDVPSVNASFGKDTIDYHSFMDISVAVATPRGLVVPVIRDVQNLNLADIERTITDFAERARNNKLTMAEMTGGTFTISNGGVFGSWMGTPIINPPQSAILGMHAIKKKPWVVGDKIEIRDIMAVALTYDHRLIDGSEAVTFLMKVKNLIEEPTRMVLDLS